MEEGQAERNIQILDAYSVPSGHACSVDSLICKAMAELLRGMTISPDVRVGCLKWIFVGHIHANLNTVS